MITFLWVAVGVMFTFTAYSVDGSGAAISTLGAYLIGTNFGGIMHARATG